MYLKEGKIDFGVVTEPFAEDETMDIQVVREVEDIFVAAHRYTQLKNHMVDLHELPDYPVIFLEKIQVQENMSIRCWKNTVYP